MDDVAVAAYAAGLLGEYLAQHWQDKLAAVRTCTFLRVYLVDILKNNPHYSLAQACLHFWAPASTVWPALCMPRRWRRGCQAYEIPALPACRRCSCRRSYRSRRTRRLWQTTARRWAPNPPTSQPLRDRCLLV